jgi:hypothetical protein
MAESTGSSVVRYPVVFQDADHVSTAGRLEVVDGCVLLTGDRRGKLVEHHLPCAELSEVRIGRAASERLNGYATIVLVRRGQEPVLVAPFGSVLLHEIADLVATLAAKPMDVSDEIDLIVLLRPNARQRVRELIAQGPPFDPAALNLRRHQVLLGPDDVIFAFEGLQIRQTLERTLSQPRLWKAGVAWRRCIAGPPRIRTRRPQHNKTRTRLQLATTTRDCGEGCNAVIAAAGLRQELPPRNDGRSDTQPMRHLRGRPRPEAQRFDMCEVGGPRDFLRGSLDDHAPTEFRGQVGAVDLESCVTGEEKSPQLRPLGGAKHNRL